MQYDGLKTVMDAMQRAGTVTDTKAIAKAIRNHTYHGLVDWQYDDKGLGRQTMEGVYIVEGVVKEIRPIPIPD